MKKEQLLNWKSQEPKTVREMIKDGDFKNKVPYPSGSYKDPIVKEQREAYRTEEGRLIQLFKDTLEKEFGVQANPKANLLFEKAWANGHAYGFSEILNHYEDLVDFIK